MSSFSQLRAFNAVARAGSFSAAGERLRISQPGVTLQVRELERSYNVTLFNRRTAGIELTSDGHDLYELTKELFGVKERVDELFQRRQTLTDGEMTIAADGPHIALSLIARFKESYPGIRTLVQMGNWQTTWKAVVEHRVDVAILANPPDVDTIERVQLTRQDMVALLPPGHDLENRASIKISEIADQPLVMREQGSNTRKTLEHLAATTGINLEVSMELDTREAMREAVYNGFGIGFLFDQEIADDSRCVAVPIEELRESNKDTLVCLSRYRHLNTIAAMMTLARTI